MANTNDVEQALEKVALAETGSDSDLPDDLKNFIEEVVEGDAESVNVVTCEHLRLFFEKAAVLLRSDSLSQKIDEATNSTDTNNEENAQKKLDKIRDCIEDAYEQVWKSLKIDPMLGKHAINTVQDVLENPNIEEDEREKLSDAVSDFGSAEHDLVGTKLLGEEEFRKREEKRREVQEEREKIVDDLNKLSPTEKGEYIMALKNKGVELRKKLVEMGHKNAIEYMDNPTEEDAKLLTRLSALSGIIQEMQGEHGHSHNGEPCSGHGHSSHDHSHDHGHSHGGQPCSGHGHSSHGHSHESHGHSHNGKPCGGHSHSE